MRETCIWLTPIASPISVCVRSSTKRRYRTRRSRGVSVRDAVRHDVARLDELELGVLAAERGAERAGLAVRAAGGLLERRRPRRHRELERVEHRVEGDAGVLGQLEGRRGVAAPGRQLLLRADQREDALLVAAHDLHRPAVVAVVALELAGDRRHGEGRELAAAFGVEAVDRAEQPDAGDLHEVVQRLGAAVVAPGEAAGERQEAFDELVAGGGVAEARVAAEQALDSRRAGLRGTGRRAATGQRRESVRCGDGDRPPKGRAGNGARRRGLGRSA